MLENHSGHCFTCQICGQAFAGEELTSQVLAEQCENDPLPDLPTKPPPHMLCLVSGLKPAILLLDPNLDRLIHNCSQILRQIHGT